jgi:hypothetical protein
LEGGQSLPATVRDTSASTAAGKAWRKVKAAACAEGLDSFMLSQSVARALERYADAAKAERDNLPECTQDALRNLRKALAAVLRDPVALQRLDAGQGQAFDLADALRRPVPPGQGQGILVVKARELADRLHRCANEAVKLQAPANRRGRKTPEALRWLVLCLASDFELTSRRRATATPGGPFARFLAAVVAYHAALCNTPAPKPGHRTLQAAMKEHRARYPWPRHVPQSG